MARTFTLFFLFVIAVMVTAAQTSSFTYQGKLTDGGALANGQYDLVFRLFDPSRKEIASLTKDDVQIINDLFNVTLDFGSRQVAKGTKDSIETRPAAGAGSWCF